MKTVDPIAVVGISGLFPGALDVSTLWSNICSKKDETRSVRAERWIAPPAVMLSPNLQPEKAYSDRCCLLPDFSLNAQGLDLPDEVIAALDPLHLLALQAGREAVLGDFAPKLNRQKTSVILAALVLPTDASCAHTRRIIGRFMEEAVCRRPPAHMQTEASGRNTWLASRVASMPAALVAAGLGLGGGGFTLDAACASSLYAIKLACDDLRAGRADAVLAGGAARPDCLFTQVGFSQLKALSPSGRCSPFDRDADGLIVGEGAGILVLKRLDDALKDGDAIWGLVRGIGISNDLRGNLLAPDSEGQLRAMRSAFAAAGWRPPDVDLIECHGAGTPVGDATELNSLRTLWGESGWEVGSCRLGSIKSMIGHLLTAAGAAGTIKILMAMRHGIMPPTINFRQPPAGSPLIDSPFRVQTEVEAWERRDAGTPRRAAVSAFGFGGINAHLLLEEWDAEFGQRNSNGGRRSPPAAIRIPNSQVAIVGMSACFGRAATLADFQETIAAGGTLIGPRPLSRWKGCDQILPHLQGLEGCFLEEIVLAPGEFHIPPKELRDILPQHLLMLKSAAAAVADANLPLRTERVRMGALIGIAFDFEATNFDLRWYLEKMFPEWQRSFFPQLSQQEASDWLAALKDGCSPPLTASRTLGSLGSMVASRIARELRFGGPSFVVSAEEASGLRALEIGVRALCMGELDAALVGAVDLCGEIRRVAAEDIRFPAPMPPPGEGAAALVLKRLDDARAQGDRVYAVIRGIGAACGPIAPGAFDGEAYLRSLERAVAEAGGLSATTVAFESHAGASEAEMKTLKTWAERQRLELALCSVNAAIGRTGAVSGLASLVKAALGLHAESDFGSRAETAETCPQADAGGRHRHPQKNGMKRPRWAAAGITTSDGTCMHVVLEACNRKAADRPSPGHARVPNSIALEKAPALHTDGTFPIRIPVAGPPIVFPPMPEAKRPSRRIETSLSAPNSADPFAGSIHRMASVSEATTSAHAAFLTVSAGMTRDFQEALTLYSRLAEPACEPPLPLDSMPAFDRNQCLEFARGSAARVLGREFSELDGFKARVRLPDEPLMLVDRIIAVQGDKGSLSSGRIITEHDVQPGAWYLDGGRAPVCISVEAGQADLFLCAWLGIDLAVRGERTYRLLDATVEFHRGLPLPGETIRYVIQIEKFIRQGDTYLFLFHFKGTIDGVPLISMTDGCAGFFTREEVENSGGIILTEEDKQAIPGDIPADWRYPVPLSTISLNAQEVDALRRGDLAAGFGRVFEGVRIAESLRLPGGRMRLIDRILSLEPEGGRFGLGRIRAEADIQPDAWFLTCHFVDDMVMPGTLMYECCAHALRVWVQRLGWVSDLPESHYEPLPGVKATLKCRGPVTPETRQVVYEVDVKALGYTPEPFVIADANMYADGRHIVRFRDMSLQLKGVTRTEIERFWDSRREAPAVRAPALHPGPPFLRSHFEEFARGRPSLAFGEAYAPFDSDRFIARLPAPPYLFMDRITQVQPRPWVLKPGGWIEAEYDLAPDAWYIAAERTGSMPYCVLLEMALQPCGWLAAYMGSALKSDKSLYFRNLGGRATLHRTLDLEPGILRARTRMTQVSEVTDMIIEHFDFEVRSEEGPVYDGSTYFGFFTRSALERPEGIRKPWEKGLPPAEDERFRRPDFVFPGEAPLYPEDPHRRPHHGLAFPSGALRMIDQIDFFLPEGGPRALGYVRGSKRVDPDEWFFRAHFHQDPVWPGSLGLESFLQLLKFAALHRWPQLISSHRFAATSGTSHRWTYRGQILPHNRVVTVEALITRVDEKPHPALFAEGYLTVDGLCIYHMEDFGISLIPEGQTGAAREAVSP